MDKKTMLIKSKISFFAIVIILIFPMLISAYDLEEYYPLKEGNSWTYMVVYNDNYLRDIFKIEGKEIVKDVETIKMHWEKLDSYGYTCIAIDSQGAKQYKAVYQEEDRYELYNPSLLLFPNNIETEESSSYSVNSVIYDINGNKLEETSGNGNIKLDSIEDANVPAGNFKNCLKFSSLITWVESDSRYEEDCTFRLAPGIGKVEEFCIITKYDEEGKIIDINTETRQLISAVINGSEIQSQ